MREWRSRSRTGVLALELASLLFLGLGLVAFWWTFAEAGAPAMIGALFNFALATALWSFRRGRWLRLDAQGVTDHTDSDAPGRLFYREMVSLEVVETEAQSLVMLRLRDEYPRSKMRRQYVAETGWDVRVDCRAVGADPGEVATLVASHLGQPS